MVLDAEMFGGFQDWCLRTYGDSGKTKTVTRRKYNKIMQTLLQGDEPDGVYVESSTINAKFKFWVKSKGFQVGSSVLSGHSQKGGSGKPVLYVPVKSTVSCALFCRTGGLWGGVGCARSMCPSTPGPTVPASPPPAVSLVYLSHVFDRNSPYAVATGKVRLGPEPRPEPGRMAAMATPVPLNNTDGTGLASR